MVRTQVRFTQEQIRALRQYSAATGRSIAELIRCGVELYLISQHPIGKEERVRRALHAAGRFSSGSRDGSAKHDRRLAEAFRA